jgi:hypothetical protein
MDWMQGIVILILVGLSSYGFLIVARSLMRGDYRKGIFPLIGLYFSTLISLLVLSIVLNVNAKLREEIEKKCPEYEKIENVYIIKGK